MRHARRVAAGALGLAMVLTACGGSDSTSQDTDTGTAATDETEDGDDGGGTSSGGGVAFGASMEEYQAAFEDVEPITLNTQSPVPEGSLVGRPFEAYFDALEEWSGGKITLDVQWSNAVAGAAEADQAVADGRLDFASVQAVLDPDQYPAFSALVDTSFVGNAGPLVSILNPHAYIAELALNNEQVVQEYEDQNLRMLVPSFTGGPNAIYCSDERRSLEDFDGAQVRVTGQAHSAETEALGGVGVAMAFSEVFEALQRGAIDCAIGSPSVAIFGGLMPIVPHTVLDESNSLAQVPSSILINADRFDGLPLVAQQLLFDRTDVFVAENVEVMFELVRDVVLAADEEGGEVGPLADDAAAALEAANEAVLQRVAEDSRLEDAAAFVDAIESTSTEWADAITGDLGYTEEVAYADFGTWYEDGIVDLGPFIDRLYSDVMQPHRPS